MKNNFRVILAKQRKKVADVHNGTGISKSTLTAIYYERSKNPSMETMTKIADYLNVTLDELITAQH
ncbi:helix-turn-helix domain-containing protein [Streptococcus himalayensis]|uniref:HTH cro/C1-type domain-containing protein n=1 Tax=Streptococcus himalayensis TaxID=1888195 RepID=A0A917EGV7_9STRE|nr:helix-turn-helix transcriptional regulator [Streptococcus himalayensis]QBX08399.1 HTH DNA-binding protein [Streptococcus satellite phage Javan257]GGE34582.1 hypothetical protein GCM10011510_14880 [Streptococcus himalayensis]